MKTDTWINEMVKQINDEKKKEEPSSITLSDDDINRVADIMIKKMSEVSAESPDNSDRQPTNSTDTVTTDDGETLID